MRICSVSKEKHDREAFSCSHLAEAPGSVPYGTTLLQQLSPQRSSATCPGLCCLSLRVRTTVLASSAEFWFLLCCSGAGMRAGRGAEHRSSLGPLLEWLYSFHVLVFGFMCTRSPALLSRESVYVRLLLWFWLNRVSGSSLTRIDLYLILSMQPQTFGFRSRVAGNFFSLCSLLTTLASATAPSTACPFTQLSAQCPHSTAKQHQSLWNRSSIILGTYPGGFIPPLLMPMDVITSLNCKNLLQLLLAGNYPAWG